VQAQHVWFCFIEPIMGNHLRDRGLFKDKPWDKERANGDDSRQKMANVMDKQTQKCLLGFPRLNSLIRFCLRKLRMTEQKSTEFWLGEVKVKSVHADAHINQPHFCKSRTSLWPENFWCSDLCSRTEVVHYILQARLLEKWPDPDRILIVFCQWFVPRPWIEGKKGSFSGILLTFVVLWSWCMLCVFICIYIHIYIYIYTHTHIW